MTSPFLPDVDPGDYVEANWGNAIRNRTITPFATNADRDTMIPVKTVGMTVWISSTNQLQVWTGTVWQVLGISPPPYCDVVRSIPQGVPNGTNTFVSFNFTRSDALNMHNASGTAVQQQSIVIPVDGIYLLTSYVNWEFDSGGYRNMDITLNSTTIVGASQAPTGVVHSTSLTASTVFPCPVGTTIRTGIFQDSGVTLDVARAEMTATWLGTRQ